MDHTPSLILPPPPAAALAARAVGAGPQAHPPQPHPQPPVAHHIAAIEGIHMPPPASALTGYSTASKLAIRRLEMEKQDQARVMQDQAQMVQDQAQEMEAMRQKILQL